MSLCLMSEKRSFGDETTAYSFVRQTGAAEESNSVPWVQCEWLNYYNTLAPRN